MRTSLAFLLGVAAALAPVEPAAATYDYKVPCDKTSRAGTSLVRGFNCRAIQIQGYPRRYVVYVPRDAAFRRNRKAPLVVGFHGSDGSGGNFLKTSGWIGRAEREGLLLLFGTALEAAITTEGGHVETKWVTPESAQTIAPDVRPDGYPASADWPANDTRFIRRMAADVAKVARVDRKRVYSVGFSNGANMAAEVVVQNPGKFAAVAGFGGSHILPRTVQEPPPYLLAFGQDDRHLGDQPVPLDPSAWPGFSDWQHRIDTAVANWGAEGDPQVTRRPKFTQFSWELDHGAVSLLAIRLIAGLGHTYPDDGTQIAWRFFERFAG